MPGLKLPLTLLAVTCLRFSPLQAQRVGDFFHHLNAEKGLSQANNAYVFHDSRGFVWISSIDGLNRFDGLNVRGYRPNTSQPRALFGQNVISPMFEDGNGDLWFCTYEAINCYRRQTDNFEHWQLRDPRSGQLLVEDYYAFFLDRRGLFWLRIGDGLAGQLFQFDTRTGHATATGPLYGNRCFADTTAEGAVENIYSFFYGGGNGLYRWQRDRAGHFFPKKYLEDPQTWLTDLWIERPDRIWLAGQAGLIALDPGKATATPYPLGSAAMAVRPLDPARLIVSTQDAGLLVFDRRQHRVLQRLQHDPARASSISHAALNDVYIDPDRTIWVSDWEYGINFCNPAKQRFQPLVLERIDSVFRQKEYSIQCLAEDRHGQQWCATTKAGLLIFRDGRLVRRIFRQCGLPDTYLPWVCRDWRGTMWLYAEGKGVFWYDETADRFLRVAGSEKIPPAISACLRQTSDSTYLLAAGSFYQIKCNPARNGYFLERTAGPGGLTQGPVGYFYIDRLGNAYVNVNSAQTLIVGADGRVSRLPFNNLKSAWEMPDGKTLWLATTYGLARINLEQRSDMQLFDESNGLPNQYLYSVVSDSAGYLWLSSNKGILRFDPRTRATRQYGPVDGIWEDEFYTNAWLCGRTGEIWMGNRAALNVFRPGMLRDLPIQPGIQITGLKVNDVNWKSPVYIGECKALEFSWPDNTLSFEFVALEYSNPTKNRLKYALEGYDRQWVDIPPGLPGFARYANLPPGDYVLNIRAANSDGVWTPQPRTLHIHIGAPFWQTWWFLLLGSAALVALIWAGIATYYRRREHIRRLHFEKELAVEHERHRISRDLHDDLGSGLGAIGLLADIALSKTGPSGLQQEIGQIAASSRALSSNIREIIWAANPQNDWLDNLIGFLHQHAVSLFNGSDLELVAELPHEVPVCEVSGERRRALFLAYKEALHNIVKHAGATRVAIEFSCAENELRVSVRDNGRGFDPAATGDSGNGLFNMRRRMEEAGGSIRIESGATGTQLLFQMPV